MCLSAGGETLCRWIRMTSNSELPISNVRTVSSAVQICHQHSHRDRSRRMLRQKQEAGAASPRGSGPF
jgi:hypothetical protein